MVDGLALACGILIALVAIEHLYILYVEMFAWTTVGKRIFKGSFDDQMFEKTKAMAANQGLYNGFLAAGLIWSLLINDTVWSLYVAMFFLGCVIIAATYGAFSVSKKILLSQGLPAMIAMFVVLVRYFSI